MAVEGELERRAGEPHLQAGAIARQRGEQVGRIGARVERLARATTNRPVAPKLREIDGQANDSSTSDSSSDTPRDGSTTVIVPPLTRISENDSTRWRLRRAAA